MRAVLPQMCSSAQNRTADARPGIDMSRQSMPGDELFANLLAQAGSTGSALVAEIQTLVESGRLDRIAARAVYLILHGQLDLRDLRQLLPRDRVRVRSAVRKENAAAGVAIPESPSLPNISAGITLGRYRVKGIIHEGANAVVCRADHPEWGRPVAIKVATTVRGAAMLRNEAAILARITHPNVLRVWDGGVGEAPPFLVSEYVPGGNVYRWLRRRGRLSWQQTWRIARDVVRGLLALRRAGFLHGDIKPSNLLIHRGGRVILADFGVARKVSGLGPLSEEIFGSWPYMAPECFTSPGDIRSDIYSLGLTLYQLLTGVQPITVQTQSECLNAHLKLNLEPPHWLDADVPMLASELILRMAAKDPSDRPSRYEELLHELKMLDPRRNRRVPGTPRSDLLAPTDRAKRRRRES